MLPASAAANDHLVKVSEVFGGTPGAPDAQFVELQSFAATQTTFANNPVNVYDANNVLIGNFPFTANAGDGASQATMLAATPEAAAFFGVTPDVTITPVIPSGNPGEGGKVCYVDTDNPATLGIRDCVSFGPFLGDPNGDDGLTGTEPRMRDDTGNPFGPVEGIEPGHAIQRDISAGNPTLLEDADDTGDSAADFFDTATPTPRNNAAATTTTAGSAAVTAGVLDFDAAAGVANRLRISRSGSDVVINDVAAPITAGAGCTQSVVNEIRCTLPVGSTIDLSTGDQVDTLTAPNGFDLTVDAGAGNDRITSRNGDDTLVGGDGKDRLTSGLGADTLRGLAGNDTVVSGTAPASPTDGSADQLFCGSGPSDHAFADTGEGDSVPTGGAERCEAVN